MPVAHLRPDGRDRYTISGLSAHTLRWYERIGLFREEERWHTGRRRFTDRDFDRLSLVRKLRPTGMPVAAVRGAGARGRPRGSGSGWSSSSP